MARNLTPKEFYGKICKETGVTQEDAHKVWLQAVDVILSELKMYGFVKLPYIANIELKYKEGGYRKVPDNHNGYKLVDKWVEPKYTLSFQPTKFFKQQVNGEKLSRAEIKRQRALIKEEELKLKERERQRQILGELQDSVANAIKVKEEKYGLRKPSVEDDENTPSGY